jgi:hypothetical protein
MTCDTPNHTLAKNQIAAEIKQKELLDELAKLKDKYGGFHL